MHNVKRRMRKYVARLLPAQSSTSTCKAPREAEHGRSTSQVLAASVDTSGDVGNVAHGLQALKLSAAASHLPPELLVQIFSCTEPPAVVRCRQVCRRFQQIIDGTPEIRYIIELYISGYRNNEADTSTNTSDRLKALQSHYDWWKSSGSYSWQRGTLDWPLDYASLQPDQYYDNLWLISNKDSTILEEQDVPSFRVNTIKCVCFEETLEGSPTVDSWVLSFTFEFDAFVADPSRGVLHLVRLLNSSNCRNFRVRTVSSTDGSILNDHLFEGEAGEEEIPWALDFSMYCIDGILVCTTWVDGIIGQHPSLVDVVLLDTTAGRIVATHSRNVTTSAEVSLQLLSKDVYLLHIMETGRFTTEVYKLVPTSSSPALEIYHVATFEFPRMRRKFARRWSFTVTPTHLHGGRLHRKAPPPPFLRAQATPLVVIYRCFVNAVLQHYIPSSVFTSRAERFDPAAQPRGASPPTIQWKSWGPENSRCFINTKLYNASMGHCFGSQVLLDDLTLLDFNTKILCRDLQRAGVELSKLTANPSIAVAEGQRLRFFRRSEQARVVPQDSEDVYMPGSPPHLITSPTIIPKGRVFEEDIVTVLPYVESQLKCDELGQRLRFYGDTWLVCARRDGNFVYYLLDRRASQPET